jgi:hypothetical protein
MNIEIPKNLSIEQVFEFADWLGEYYIRLATGEWVPKSLYPEKEVHKLTTEELYKTWIYGV